MNSNKPNWLLSLEHSCDNLNDLMLSNSNNEEAEEYKQAKTNSTEPHWYTTFCNRKP